MRQAEDSHLVMGHVEVSHLVMYQVEDFDLVMGHVEDSNLVGGQVEDSHLVMGHLEDSHLVMGQDGNSHLLMGHVEDLGASNGDQQVIGSETHLLCQAPLRHLISIYQLRQSVIF